VATKKTAPKAKTTINANTLAIDVGGSGLKAAILDPKGKMLTERLRVTTPQPCAPALLVEALVDLTKQTTSTGEGYSRISVGFPGLVRGGVVRTAPNLGNEAFAGFDIAAALAKKLGAPCRAVNDADMQGLAVISGEGVEMVVTLGTGFGTALFSRGRLQSHLEIAHLPFRKDETYDVQLGDKARREVGNKKWEKRVREALDHMRVLTGFDRLYIGGGNAEHLEEQLDADMRIVDNAAGVLGGIKLWDSQRDEDV
jgi:polyphosphate glucokinase